MDHNILVDKVITRLDEEGFALKLSKCNFSMNRLSWLGYDIDSEGYRPKRSKIDAVLAIEPPKLLKQLRFLSPSLKARNTSKFVWGRTNNQLL